MTTSYSRVTVAHDARTVDLAMPSALPLADVMPQLLTLCLPDSAAERPLVWGLGRPGQTDLDPGRSLADAGIRDGDVLELRKRTDSPQPAYVEDVRDAVEDAVDGSGLQWTPATTRGFVLASGATALAAVALLTDVREPRDLVTLTAAAGVATALVPGAWWVAKRSHPALTQLVIGVACLWGGLAGWLAASWLSSDRLVWLAAAGAVLVVAAVMRSITALAAPHLAASTLLVAAAAAAAALSGSDPYDAARALGVAAVIAAGALPRVSLTAGGLAAADYRVRNAPLLTQQALHHRIRQSSWLLTGALLTLAVVGGLAAVALAYRPGGWDRLLAAAIGCALILRSRLFSRIPHVLPLRLAGATVLAALALRHGADVDMLRPWLAVATLVVVALLALVSAIPLSDITRARVKQLLNWSEYIVVVAMMVLAAGALGVYDAVAARSG